MGQNPISKTCDNAVFTAPSQVRLSQPNIVSEPILGSTEVLPVPEATLSLGARKLLRWMIWRGGRNRQLWWSQSRMAEDLKLGLRTLQRNLAELVSLQAVIPIRRGRSSCLYNLSVDCGNLLAVGGLNGGSKPLYLITESNGNKNKLAEPLERKPPTKEKTLRDPAEPEYIEEFARVMKYNPCPVMARLASAAASVGIPAEVAGQLARKIDQQPRWRSPHQSIRNPFAYKIAVIEKELLGVRRVA